MKPETYKAAIFRRPGYVDVVNLEYPECADDEAIVRNLLTGICGSDVAAYNKKQGQATYADMEFGHEAISEVVELGKNVTGLAVGDRVFVNQDKAMRDRRRISATGGFSNYLRIPQCVAGYSLLKIDNDLSLRTTVLFEPFIIGTRGVKGLKPQRGDSAIVFGAGIIGLTSAIMLDWYGCDKVMVVDLSDFRLENARRFGFATCNPSKEDLKTKAVAEFGGQQSHFGERCKANLYVDAVGAKSVLENFTMLAPRNASITIVGVHKEPVALDLVRVSFSNWRIQGCGDGETEELLPDVLAMMRARGDVLSSLVTHQFNVDQINEALTLAGDPHNAQKVCISF